MANRDAGDVPAPGGGGAPGAVEWDGTAWVVPGTTWVWDGAQWVDRGPATAPTPAPPPPPPPPPAQAATPAAGPTPAAPSPMPPPGGIAAPWPPAGAAGTAPPVSRGALFGHVLWRVAVVCIGGGAVVGFLFILVLLAFPDDEGDRAFSFLLVGPLFGGILGAMLSVVAAPTIAGVCAGTLVPYPGRARTLLTVRLLAMGLVALFLLLLLSGAVLDVGVIVALAGLSAVSLAGAWFGSSWVIGWYVKRCESTPAA